MDIWEAFILVRRICCEYKNGTKYYSTGLRYSTPVFYVAVLLLGTLLNLHLDPLFKVFKLFRQCITVDSGLESELDGQKRSFMIVVLLAVCCRIFTWTCTELFQKLMYTEKRKHEKNKDHNSCSQRCWTGWHCQFGAGMKGWRSKMSAM